MSRSVTIPQGCPSSSMMTEPTFAARMRRAASMMGVEVVSVMGCSLMSSRTFLAMVFPPHST